MWSGEQEHAEQETNQSAPAHSPQAIFPMQSAAYPSSGDAIAGGSCDRLREAYGV
jgi:hypothetical protein